MKGKCVEVHICTVGRTKCGLTACPIVITNGHVICEFMKPQILGIKIIQSYLEKITLILTVEKFCPCLHKKISSRSGSKSAKTAKNLASSFPKRGCIKDSEVAY